MSRKHVLVLCLLLGSLALGTCRDEPSLHPTAPDLAEGSVPPVGNVEGDPRPHCQPTKVPVALAAGQAAEHTIFGELCLPPGTDRQRVPTVHLAVHGATYSHLYWGWPYQPDTYSYIDHLLAAGYAVFTFDRIGVGQSSQPPGASVTIDVNAFVVHQLVKALRRGSIGKTAFRRVVLVGHGLGSIAALAFAREACLETVVIEDTGHYLNLEPTAPATYAAIRAWSDALVGLYQPAPRCRPGLPFRRTYSRNSASDPENRNGLRRPDRDAPAPRPHRVGVPG